MARKFKIAVKKHPFTKLEKEAQKKRDAKKKANGLADLRKAAYVAERLKPGSTRKGAARKAGYLSYPAASVDAIVAERAAALLTSADANAERILLELCRIAFFDPRKMFNEDGTMRQISEFDDDTAAAISGFDIERRTEGRGEDREEYYVLKPRTVSKNQALEMLAKYRKLLDGTGDDRQKDRLNEIVQALQESPK